MTGPFHDQLSEGIRHREEALDAHEANHRRDLLIVRQRFAQTPLAHGRASLNDLLLTPNLKGKYLGSVDRPFRRWIAEDRMVKSTDPRHNARRIVEWILTDADAVRAWLISNPLPDPTPASDAASQKCNPARTMPLFDDDEDAS